MNPDPQFRSCTVKEEPEDEDDEPRYHKTYKQEKTIQNVSTKLEEYWKEVRYRRQKSNCSVPVEDDVKKPDQNWVQCDDCRNWRKLPDGIVLSQLPDQWFCYMNPDPQFRCCTVEEELEDSDDEQPRNQKTYKQDEKNQKLQEKNRQQSPVQGTPYSSLNSRPQRHAGFWSPQVPAPSPISTRKKRPMGQSRENREMKRARAGDSFGSNTPSRPSTSTASPEFFSPPILDNSVSVWDQVTRQYNETALPPVSLSDTSIATQTQQVKEEEGDTERMGKGKGSKIGENVINCFEFEKALVRNTNKQPIKNEEIRVQQKSVPSSKLSPSTVETEKEPNHMEVSDDIRQRGQTSSKLENSILDVLEAQKQQDNLLELLEEVTKERDESCAQLLVLNSQVDELRSQLLELNQSMVKKEQSHNYTQTSQEEAQDYKVLYLKGKEEIKLLQEELSGLKMEKEERERKGQQSMLECDDDLACQMDILLREIDQRNKEREELQVKVESLKNENCSLSTSCESLKKDLEEMKRESEKVKVRTEDRVVQTDFPSCSHEESTTSAEASNSGRGTDLGIQQHETQDRPETGQDNNNLQRLKLRELRQTMARLLVTLAPDLDLQQVNYDCDAIDEILVQVVNEISPTETAST